MKYRKLILVLFLISCANGKQNNRSTRSPSNFLTSFYEIHNQSYYIPRAFYNDDFLDKVTSLEILDDIYGNESFQSIYNRKTPTEINNHNQLVLSLLKTERETNLANTGHVTTAEVKKINKVIKSSRNEHHRRFYDPSGLDEFCYARAVMAHAHGIHSGVDPSSIKKIWSVGNAQNFYWHVATLMKAESGWWAVDSEFFPKGVTDNEWIQKFLITPEEKPNMIFIANGTRFSQASPTTLNALDLFNTLNDSHNPEADAFRGYFKDFFEDLENKPKQRYPLRNLTASGERIFQQVESLYYLRRAYPYLYLPEGWDELFNLAKQRMNYQMTQFTLPNKRILKGIEYFTRFSLDLGKNIQEYRPYLEMAMEDYFKLLTKKKETLSFEKLKAYPQEKVLNKVAEIFRNSINEELIEKLMNYYILGNYLSSSDSQYKRFISILLGGPTRNTKVQSKLILALDGNFQPWVYDILQYQVNGGTKKNRKVAKSMLEKFKLNYKTCHDPYLHL